MHNSILQIQKRKIFSVLKHNKGGNLIILLLLNLIFEFMDGCNW